ncbi:uncharacterized protein TNCV_2246031 [Trichonephila clavipes]|uniref:Uncharacterized protein n=1 Tax=Trichonephila clavipes TaxID=2585209 RepID=A0A8X6UVX6_TRICX|nr:uncharacterized protein TNCV_2246031 [Trichonephila clavipes]
MASLLRGLFVMGQLKYFDYGYTCRQIEVNQFKNLKLMKSQESLKLPELEANLALKSKNIERYKKNAVTNRALIAEKDNTIKRMECHIKYIWDVLIDISGKLGRAGILTEKQKRNLLREYEEEFLSLNISIDEDGKDIKSVLNALPTILSEVPDTSTSCIKKINDLSSKDELRSSSVCSSTPSLSANEVTSSDDFHTDSLRNKLLMHPLIKRAKARKSLSRNLKSSLPHQEHEEHLISCPSPDTLSSEKEKESFPEEQSKTEINLITLDFESNKNESLEIIERSLTANYSASLNESDICQSKSYNKDISSAFNTIENSIQIPSISVCLIDIPDETAGNIHNSEKIMPIEKNPAVFATIQQEFNCEKQIHEKSKEEIIKKQCIPNVFTNVSNDMHKKAELKETMLYDNPVCDFEMTSTPEKTSSNVVQNDFYILDDSLEEMSDLEKINFDFLPIDCLDDIKKISNPEETNCNLLQNDLNISDDDLNLSEDDILIEFKKTLSTLNKLPTCISPIPPTPPKVGRLFEVPGPLNNNLEKPKEILHLKHIISSCSNKETVDISDEHICSNFDKESTSANLKSPSSKILDFDFSSETNNSPEEIINNKEILLRRNLPTYSHNSVSSGSGVNDRNIFSETSLNSRNDGSFSLQNKNICFSSKLGCHKSLTSQASSIYTNECQDLNFKKYSEKSVSSDVSLNKTTKKSNSTSLKCSGEINESETVSSNLNFNNCNMSKECGSLHSNLSENVVNSSNDSYSLPTELQDEEQRLNEEIIEDNSGTIELSVNKQISRHNLHTKTKKNSVSDSSNNISEHVFSFDKQSPSQLIEDIQDIFSSEVLNDFSHTICFKNVPNDLNSNEDDCSKANNCEANFSAKKKLDVKSMSVNKTLLSDATNAKSHLKVLRIESCILKKKSKNKFLFHRSNSKISQNQNIHKPKCITESEKDSFIKKISVEGIEKDVIEQIENVPAIKGSEQNTLNRNFKDFEELVESSVEVESEASSLKREELDCLNFIAPVDTSEKKSHDELNGNSNKIICTDTCIKNLFEESLEQSTEVELQTSVTKRKVSEFSSSTVPLKKLCNEFSKRNSSSKKKIILLPGPSMSSNTTKSRLINKALLNLTKEEMQPKKCSKECSNLELKKKPYIVKKIELNVGNSLKKKIKNTASELVAPVRIKGRTFQRRNFSKKSRNDDSITSFVDEKQNIDCSKTLEDVECSTSIVNELENTECKVNKKPTKVRKEHKKKNSSVNVFSSITTNSNPSDSITLLNSSLMEEKLLPVDEVTLKNPLDLLPDEKLKTNLSATKVVLNLVKNQSSFKHKLVKIQEYAAKQNAKRFSNYNESIVEMLQNDNSSKKVTLKQNSVSTEQSETQLSSRKLILKDFEETTSVQNKVCSLGEKRKLHSSVKNFQTSRKKSIASTNELVNERKESCFNNSVAMEKSKIEENLAQICFGESSIHQVFTVNKSKQALLNKNSNFSTISDNYSTPVVNLQDNHLLSASPGNSKFRKAQQKLKRSQEYRKRNMHLRNKNKISEPSPNLIQDILQGIENVRSTDKHFKPYVHALTNYLINPANASDVKAKTLNITYQLILAKTNFRIRGQASFCRVLTEICKRKGDKSLPLSLCCDLLKARHRFSPYLVASVVGVWKEPFKLSDDLSDEEVALFGAIAFGTKKFSKNCTLMHKPCYLKFLSENLPTQSIADTKKAIEFVQGIILLNCLQNSYNDLWKLTSTLVILSGRENWDWIERNVIDAYIVDHLDKFSSQMFNKQAFDFFCNLYVDIAVLNQCYRAENKLILYFRKEILNKDDSFIKDSAAIAIIKLSIFEKREMPTSVLKWFEKNKDNPKLAEIEDVFQRRLIYDDSQYLSVQDIVGV